MKSQSSAFEEIPKLFSKFQREINKVIIGQETVLKKIFIALLCKGHSLLIGVPGLAKTTLVNCFAHSLDLSFNRIQFTPDLMPADIIGNEILQENKHSGNKKLIFHKGPIFSNVLLGDEINRTPPKTQSALLQAMQEKIVTVFGHTEKIFEPFIVLATQNPIEQEGTYPLPEAQLDRFIFSIEMDYPSESDEIEIIKKHSSHLTEVISPVLKKEKIKELQEFVLSMSVPDHVYEFAVKLVRNTRPGNSTKNQLVNNFVQWGAGPRASNFLILASKGNALLEGRPVPANQDIDEVLHAVLKHRIVLNFKAEAENLKISRILKSLKF
jgi:MoxR-like ATPase